MKYKLLSYLGKSTMNEHIKLSTKRRPHTYRGLMKKIGRRRNVGIPSLQNER